MALSYGWLEVNKHRRDDTDKQMQSTQQKKKKKVSQWHFVHHESPM
jgi:hypothetical protein